MSTLRQLGILICLDDFGTGYSSLGRLRRFPVNILKIDRSFVAHMDTDPAALAIVHLIVDFAHTIGLQVIAEGVETAAHMRLLRNLKCEFGQGYYFSKAVDAPTLEALLERKERDPHSTWVSAQAAGAN